MKKEYFKIIDSPNIKTSEIMQKCRDKFMIYSYYDDIELDKQFPPPKEETTRYFLKTQDTDEDLKNKSADDLKKESIDCITLRERLIMELQYFEETGNNLDLDTVTLCAGSRFADGSVPGVDCYVDGDVNVFRYEPLLRDAYLRARRAFTFNPSNSFSSDIEQAIKVVKEAGYKIYKEI